MAIPIDAGRVSCDSATGISEFLCALRLPFEPSYWLIQGVALCVTAFVLPGLKMTSIFGPLLMIVSLAIVNAFLWDTSLFFNIPNDFSTHAMMVAGWNAVIFWLLVKLLPGIEVEGIVAPILAPILLTAATLFAGQYAHKVDWSKLTEGVVREVHEQRELLKNPISPSTRSQTKQNRELSERF